MMPYMEIIDNVRKIFKGDLSILHLTTNPTKFQRIILHIFCV